MTESQCIWLDESIIVATRIVPDAHGRWDPCGDGSKEFRHIAPLGHVDTVELVWTRASLLASGLSEWSAVMVEEQWLTGLTTPLRDCAWEYFLATCGSAKGELARIWRI